MTQASKSSFVDLYALLGLTPQSSTAEIQSALKKCATAAKAATDPAEAKRISKLFELGKANLLDVKRKRAYDKKWQAECGASSESGEMDWDWAMLDGLLPDGDPTAEFDMAKFLEHSADLPEVNPQGDFLKLQSLLTGEPITVTAVVEAELEEDPVLTEVPTLTPVSSSTAPPPPPTRYKNSPSPKSKSLAKSIRKKRNQSTYFMIGGMLISVAGIVGLLAFLLKGNDDAKPGETTTIIVTKAPEPKSKGKGENAEPAKPRRSGLPQVGGMGNEPNEGENPTSPMGQGNMGQDPMPMQPQDPKPDPGMEPMTPEPEPEPEPEPPAVVLTDKEKADWKEGMLGVREFAGQQEYDKAESEIAKLERAAKSKPQQDQLIRLKTAVDLAKICQRALLTAMSKLGPGSTFQVKSNEISFVEGGPQRLVVRIGGENKRYQLTEIPIGIVEGLVDLELDVVNQRARAARAAFILFHPKSNALTLPRARRILEEAEGDGAVAEGTSLVFDDDYELE